MLHEVLLALSGHPSPLFSNSNSGDDDFTLDSIPLLSPAEKALLKSIGDLSELHRKLKRHLESLASTHESIICRAVATSIQQVHLGRFQSKILDVESKILCDDATIVGAYKIVPLATVVCEFEVWHRLMRWYWEMSTFMRGPEESVWQSTNCNSAQLIDKLRHDTQTGYPEIESAASELARVAETTWLRQLATWVIHGKLPTHGASDFFIKDESSTDHYFTKDRALIPCFVTSSTAASIVFIGRCLHQVEQQRRGVQGALAGQGPTNANNAELASLHLRHLTTLSLPIIPTQFSRTIIEIRLSLSQNLLQHLLPMYDTLQLLTCLRQFLLMDRGEFAAALITEADDRVQSRQQAMGQLLAKDPVKALQTLTIKDAELSQGLRQVWRSLAVQDEAGEDTILEYARRHLSLVNATASTSRPSTSDSVRGPEVEISPTPFNNILYPNPTELTLHVPPPMDLFITSHDIRTYSSISSYLLAIRRGHQRLSDLWKRTSARRDHKVDRRQTATQSRTKARSMAMRKVWATCSAALFLLAETAAYFEGEIVRGSCEHFQDWVESPPPDLRESATSTTSKSVVSDRPSQRDPETLSSGHRAFLANLTFALLLTDVPFTKDLRSLLSNIDILVAFFTRLLNVQAQLDIEAQNSVDGSATAHTTEEERRFSLELDRARKKVDGDLRAVVNRLRSMDQERIGFGRYLDSRKTSERGEYEAWKGGGGVDRLLMKLDFGKVDADDGDKGIPDGEMIETLG